MRFLYYIIFVSYSRFIFARETIVDEFSSIHDRDDDLDRARNSRRNSFRPTSEYEPKQGQRNFDWERRDECSMDDDSGGECSSLENGTRCFGVLVPYARSSRKYLEMLNWYEHGDHELEERLERFRVFEGSPECWRLFREFLCAIFYPPCRDGRILRIPRSLCTTTMEKCSFLVQMNLWPDVFGDCKYSNVTSSTTFEKMFTNDCKVAKNMIWNDRHQCIFPLTYSAPNPDITSGWIFDHCSLNCTALRIESSDPIQGLLIFGIIGIFLFTVLTTVLLFMKDNAADKYHLPYLRPLSWFLVWQSIVSLCWLIQMISGAKTPCRDDGTIRLDEPSRQGGITCIAQHVFLLGGIVMASLFMASFSYAHFVYRLYPGWRSSKDYSQLAVYIISIAVISCSLALSRVDGDPVLSICFVSKSSVLGVVWYIAPLMLSSTISTVLFVLCIIIILRRNSKTRSVSDASNRFAPCAPTMAQIGFLLLSVSPCYLTSVAIVVSELFHADHRRHVVREYVACKLRHPNNIDKSMDCQLQSMTEIRLAQLNVFIMCLPALCADIWIFICVDVRREFLRFICSRNKSTDRVTNGAVAMPDSTVLLMNEHPSTDGNSAHRYRDSPAWSSTSSIDAGVMSDPENVGGMMAFKRRLKNRRKEHKKALSTTSLGPRLSLQSTRLPSSVAQAPSLNELPFPNLNNYPIMSGQVSNWWNQFGFPYPAWPWWFYQPPPMGSNGSNSNPTCAGTSTTQETKPTLSEGNTNVSSTAQPMSTDHGSAPTEPQTSSPQSTSASFMPPYYWPYPFFYPPPMPMFSTPENQPNTSMAQMTSPSLVEASKSSDKMEDDGRKEQSIEVNGQNEALKEIEETRQKPKENDEELRNSDEDKLEQISSDYDEEEDWDSEESDPEEHEFVEQQLKLLLGKHATE